MEKCISLNSISSKMHRKLPLICTAAGLKIAEEFVHEVSSFRVNATALFVMLSALEGMLAWA